MIYRNSYKLFLSIVCLSLSFINIANADQIAYVGNFKDNTVSVVNVSKGISIGTIPVAAGPHGICLSKDGRLLYVSSDGSSVINVIDTKENKVLTKIEVGKSPHGLALTPDGRILLACVNGDDKLVFIDVKKLTIIAAVKVGKPHTVSVRPDGKVAYVSSQELGNFKIAVIGIAKRALLKAIPLGKTPRDLEVSKNGKVVLFTEAGINAVQILDPANDKIIGQIATGASPHFVNIFNKASVGTIVVQGPGELLLFDKVTYKPGISIKVGVQPHWMAMSDDGNTGLVTNEGSNNVSVIDMKSGEVTATIPVGIQPRKVVILKTRSMMSTSKVTIDNFEFNPETVKVSLGESVEWKNDDGSPHAIAFNNGSAGSETIFPGKSFSRKFDKAGTYEYYCSIHNYMTGRVEVVAKS
jgi:YVTN family beta-propeller protein